MPPNQQAVAGPGEEEPCSNQRGSLIGQALERVVGKTGQATAFTPFFLWMRLSELPLTDLSISIWLYRQELYKHSSGPTIA